MNTVSSNLQKAALRSRRLQVSSVHYSKETPIQGKSRQLAVSMEVSEIVAALVDDSAFDGVFNYDERRRWAKVDHFEVPSW